MKHRYPLFWLALASRRRLVLALALGLALFETLIVVITAAVPTDSLFSSKSLPSAFQAFTGSSSGVSLASVPGLLGAGMLHPFWIALQLVGVASFGAAILAADIESGIIDLIATRPYSLRRIVIERLAAAVIATGVLAAAAVAPLAVSAATVSTIGNVTSITGLAALFVISFLLVLCFAAIAFVASCLSSHRSTVFGTLATAAASTYAINFVAEAWHPARFSQWVSPFHYYQPADAITSGSLKGSSVAVLLTVALVAIGLGIALVSKRDLSSR